MREQMRATRQSAFEEKRVIILLVRINIIR